MDEWIWIENVVFPLIGMGMGVLFMVGAYRTVNRWIDRRHEREMAQGGGGAAAAELESLKARVAALEEVAYRVQELEERVDFTERLLTRQQDRGAVGPAGAG